MRYLISAVSIALLAIGCKKEAVPTTPAEPPTAKFTVQVKESKITVDASTSDGGSENITKYTWNFGDKTEEVVSEGPKTEHTYKEAGVYKIQLLVESGSGTGTAVQEVTVGAREAVVTFEITKDVLNRMIVNLNASDSDESKEYIWDFGDGQTDTTTSPITSHTYQQEGRYEITLETEHGTDSQRITIRGATETPPTPPTPPTPTPPTPTPPTLPNQSTLDLRKQKLIQRIVDEGGPYGALAGLNMVNQGLTLDTKIVWDYLTQEGIKGNTNLRLVQQYGFEGVTELMTSNGEVEVRNRSGTLVLKIPKAIVPATGPNLELIKQHPQLWVISTGSRSTIQNGNGDLWNEQHPHWNDPKQYQQLIEAINAKKMIVATLANQESNGTISIMPDIFPCGDAMEACFTIINKELFPPPNKEVEASMVLASAAFWVFQMHQTAEETVDALKQCVHDIGEPGIDREFGNGIIDLDCLGAQKPVIKR